MTSLIDTSGKIIHCIRNYETQAKQSQPQRGLMKESICSFSFKNFSLKIVQKQFYQSHCRNHNLATASVALTTKKVSYLYCQK